MRCIADGGANVVLTDWPREPARSYALHGHIISFIQFLTWHLTCGMAFFSVETSLYALRPSVIEAHDEGLIGWFPWL